MFICVKISCVWLSVCGVCELKLEQLLMRMSHDSPDSLIFMLNAKNRNFLLLNIEKNAYKLIFECFPLLLLLLYFFLCFFLLYFFLVDVVFFSTNAAACFSIFIFLLLLCFASMSVIGVAWWGSDREREGEGEHFVEWVAYLPQRLIHWHRGIEVSRHRLHWLMWSHQPSCVSGPNRCTMRVSNGMDI